MILRIPGDKMGLVKKKLIAFILGILALITSCSTAPEAISPDWTESMFFKNAQVAMDDNRYKTALYYYEVFLIRYPENHQKVIAAEYERAFIHYKMRNYEMAKIGFQEIIRKYDESPYAMLYHPRFRFLAEKSLENMEKTKTTNRHILWRHMETKWAKEHNESLIDEESENY